MQYMHQRGRDTHSQWVDVSACLVTAISQSALDLDSESMEGYKYESINSARTCPQNHLLLKFQ